MPAAAFATPTQLATRLGRALWTAPTELAQVQTLLDDATAHLRGIIGWQVSPPAAVKTTVRPNQDSSPLPGFPVTGVTAVTSNGVALALSTYLLEDGSLRWVSGWPLVAEVTYTIGFTSPPPELVSWTCVLASQALTAVSELGALGGGGVSSVSIDDFRKSWADGGDSVGFALPVRVEEQLRQRYGVSTYVTGS